MPSWNETIRLRQKAFGAEYRRSLVRATISWSAVLAGIIFLLLLGYCVRRTHKWFERADVSVVAFAALFGGVVRLCAEVGSRRITVKGRGLYLSHAGLRRSVQYQRVDVMQVEPSSARIAFHLTDHRGTVVVGATWEQAQELQGN